MNVFKNISILFVLLSLFACASTNNFSAYKAFGEKEGLTKVVDDLVVNLLKDDKLKPFFEKIDQKRFKEKLAEQFCVVLDGPCKYTGQTMRRAHKGLDISSANFYGLVEALQKAMNKNDIPERAQNKLLSKLAPMHKDIISK